MNPVIAVVVKNTKNAAVEIHNPLHIQQPAKAP